MNELTLTPDELADKCEAWLQESPHLNNAVDGYEAGYRQCEQDRAQASDEPSGAERAEPLLDGAPDPDHPGWCIGCNPDNCQGCGNGLGYSAVLSTELIGESDGLSTAAPSREPEPAPARRLFPSGPDDGRHSTLGNVMATAVAQADEARGEPAQARELSDEELKAVWRAWVDADDRWSLLDLMRAAISADRAIALH